MSGNINTCEIRCWKILIELKWLRSSLEEDKRQEIQIHFGKQQNTPHYSPLYFGICPFPLRTSLPWPYCAAGWGKAQVVSVQTLWLLLLLLHLQPEFLLLAFKECCMIHPTLMISTRFFPVHGGSLWCLWKLFCDAAVLGSLQSATEAVLKENQEMQLQLSSCFVPHPLISLAFEEFPLASTYDPIFYSGSVLPSARWPLATKQWRAPLERESWQKLCSQSCLPISTTAGRLKSPSVPLPGHELQPPGSAFHFFFTGCLFLSCLGTEPKHSPPTSLSCSCTSCLLLNLILLNTMCLILITCPSPMKVIEI